jgi:hypothetical protein
LAGAGAFAVELVRLWVSGGGPWRHETSGAIVNIVYVATLTMAVVIIVIMPILAAILSRPGARRLRAPRRRSMR